MRVTPYRFRTRPRAASEPQTAVEPEGRPADREALEAERRAATRENQTSQTGPPSQTDPTEKSPENRVQP